MNIMYLLAERGVDIFANGGNYQVLRCVRSLSFTNSLKFSTSKRITPGSRTLHSVAKVQSSNFSSKWTKRMCQQELFSLYTRNLCSTAPPVESQESQTFKNLLTFRQQQAQHSIIVELASGEDLGDACSFCEQFGNVRKLIHYHSGSKKDFLIVEYSNAEVLHALLKSCKHNVVEGMIPVYSRLLHFDKNKKYSKGKSEVACESVHLHDETNINQQHHGTATVSEKIEEMYQRERLTDFGTRLRFLVCTQLEDALSGMFPQCKIYPFGSSVNGFGRNNCDLDVILRHYPHQSNPGSPLIFKTKKPLSSLRVQDKRSLETLSDILQNFLPGISHVNEILNARVPIVKFHHDLLEMECDLSVSQMSGVHMSELLYLCGELDPRVRPLVFAAKKWAQTSHLTNSSPGYWITNFSISLLMIFFLQTRPLPILPPFNKAINPSVLQFCDSLDDIGIKNCCEMKSASHNSNTETLDFLLKEFFHFIEAFPYKERSISVFDGHAPFKLDHSPLHIQNPLEHQLNVSKNVNEDEVNRLREAARSTLWVIETNSNNNVIKPWNFLNIFDSATKEIRKLEKVIFSDLFNKANNADYQVVATANSDKELKISFPIRKHIQDKSNVSNTSKNQVVPNINSKRKSKQNRRHLLSAKDIWHRW